ncbi:MAG: hypothetical protein OHK0029_14400 [Armatimonadaceae bacterium]
MKTNNRKSIVTGSLVAAAALVAPVFFAGAANAQQYGQSDGQDYVDKKPEMRQDWRGEAAYKGDRANEIALGGEVIMRIRHNMGGYSAEERADAIRNRLVTILAMEDLKSDEVTYRQVGFSDNYGIYVRDNLLVTVGPMMAQANNTNPEALAEMYTMKLREVLPQVVAQPSDSPFRVGEERQNNTNSPIGPVGSPYDGGNDY